MGFFTNKLVFITGGSSGIGLATAGKLASKGCDVILFARNQKRLDHAVKDIQLVLTNGSKQRINAISMDVADHNDVESKLKTAVETYGTPHILINCAGIGGGDYFENISYEQFDALMKINLYGTRNTIYSLLPFMKQAGHGQIVNIASVAGLVGMFGYTLYSTSKYALVGFSECLRSELKRFNIKVSLICPPEVSTPLIEEEAKTLPPEARAVKNLAGLLTPDQAANAIVKAIKKKKFFVVPGLMAKGTFFFHRLTNGISTRLTSDMVVSLVRWKNKSK